MGTASTLEDMGLRSAMLYLRILREARGLSQADIARVAGVESKQVYRWERGDSEPSASGIAAYRKAVEANSYDLDILLNEALNDPAPLGPLEDDKIAKRMAESWLKKHPSTQRAINRFTDRNVHCTLCNAQAWEIDQEVIAPLVGEGGAYNVLTGPHRIYATFTCHECGNTLFVFVGDVDRGSPAAGIAGTKSN